MNTLPRLGMAFAIVFSSAFVGELHAQLTETHTFSTLNAPIPDGNPAGLSDVRSITSSIARVRGVKVQLNIAGEFNGDLYCYVRHIKGSTTNLCVLLNRPGKTAANPAGYGDSGLNVTFSDSAAKGDIHLYQKTIIPRPGTALSAALQPDGRRVDPDSVLAAVPRTALLSNFNSNAADGTWTLFIADMASGGTNMLSSYSYTITGDPPLPLAPPTELHIISGP